MHIFPCKLSYIDILNTRSSAPFAGSNENDKSKLNENSVSAKKKKTHTHTRLTQYYSKRYLHSLSYLHIVVLWLQKIENNKEKTRFGDKMLIKLWKKTLLSVII